MRRKGKELDTEEKDDDNDDWNSEFLLKLTSLPHEAN